MSPKAMFCTVQKIIPKYDTKNTKTNLEGQFGQVFNFGR